MDPITGAILATLPALTSDVVKSGVKDAYEGLKAVIRRKWGNAAPIIKAIAAIEEDLGDWPINRSIEISPTMKNGSSS